jgi:hypothetical protein
MGIKPLNVGIETWIRQEYAIKKMVPPKKSFKTRNIGLETCMS